MKNGENLHENVSQIFAVESNHKYFFIVSELSEMNLEKYVIDIKESFQLRKEFGAKEVLLQACKGLNHLHQLNISELFYHSHKGKFKSLVDYFSSSKHSTKSHFDCGAKWQKSRQNFGLRGVQDVN